MHAVFGRQIRHYALAFHGFQRHANLEASVMIASGFRIPDLLTLGDETTSDPRFRNSPISGGWLHVPYFITRLIIDLLFPVTRGASDKESSMVFRSASCEAPPGTARTASVLIG